MSSSVPKICSDVILDALLHTIAFKISFVNKAQLPTALHNPKGQRNRQGKKEKGTMSTRPLWTVVLFFAAACLSGELLSSYSHDKRPCQIAQIPPHSRESAVPGRVMVLAWLDRLTPSFFPPWSTVRLQSTLRGIRLGVVH